MLDYFKFLLWLAAHWLVKQGLDLEHASRTALEEIVGGYMCDVGYKIIHWTGISEYQQYTIGPPPPPPAQPNDD